VSTLIQRIYQGQPSPSPFLKAIHYPYLLKALREMLKLKKLFSILTLTPTPLPHQARGLSLNIIVFPLLLMWEKGLGDEGIKATTPSGDGWVLFSYFLVLT
jgi:hypothetical protein